MITHNTTIHLLAYCFSHSQLCDNKNDGGKTAEKKPPFEMMEDL